MRIIALIICLVLLITGAVTARAQTVSVFGHYSIPYGDFGSTTTDAAGFAEAGYGGGLEIAVPIEVGGALGFSPDKSNTYIIGQVRILSNPVDDSTLSERLYNELYWIWTYGDVVLMDLDVDIDTYVNIPVMGGGSVDVITSPNVMLFFKALIGVNISRYPEYEIPMTLHNYSTHQDVFIRAVAETDGVGYSFCTSLSVGATISERLDIGVDMLFLGQPEFDGKISYWSEDVLIDSSNVTFAQNMAVVNLTAGIRF